MTQPADGPTENRAIRLIDINDVKAMTGLSESSIVRGMGEGWFPRGKKVGPRAVRWNEAALLAWIDALPEVEGWKRQTRQAA